MDAAVNGAVAAVLEARISYTKGSRECGVSRSKFGAPSCCAKTKTGTSEEELVIKIENDHQFVVTDFVDVSLVLRCFESSTDF